MPKRAYISSKLKSQQIGIISKLYTKINNFDKLCYKYLVNTLLKLKNNFSFHFLELLHKKERSNLTKKITTNWVAGWLSSCLAGWLDGCSLAGCPCQASLTPE